MGSDSGLSFELTLKNHNTMKKFINDNLWWIVLVAVALGGYALYRVMHNAKTETETVAATVTE